jgi:hypothetical protein
MTPPIMIKPAEHETFLSSLIRTAMANGASSLSYFCHEFGISKYHISPDNQEYVRLYYEMVNPGIDVLQQFMNTSIYPAVSSFMTEKQKRNFLEHSVYHECSSVKHLKVLGTGLHFCPECRKESDALFLRIHQVPGITICPVHHVPIMKYSNLNDDLTNPFGPVIKIKSNCSDNASAKYSSFTTQLIKSHLNCNLDYFLDAVFDIQQGFKKSTSDLIAEIDKNGLSGLMTCDVDIFRETLFFKNNHLHPLDYMILACSLFRDISDFNNAVANRTDKPYSFGFPDFKEITGGQQYALCL